VLGSWFWARGGDHATAGLLVVVSNEHAMAAMADMVSEQHLCAAVPLPSFGSDPYFKIGRHQQTGHHMTT